MKRSLYQIWWFVWLIFLDESFQQSTPPQEKRFKIQAVPASNGKIMLYLKSRFGSTGIDGPMGDKGPQGMAGQPGAMGEKGSPGYCSPQVCDAMSQAMSLLSRVEELEKLVQSRGLSLDQSGTASDDRPIVAVHISSDILLSHGNSSSNQGNALPRNINLNIALKNDMKQSSSPVITSEHDEKFLVNSTVLLNQRGAKEQKSDIAKAPAFDGWDATKRQYQKNYQQEDVPSIKKSRIPQKQKPGEY